VKKELVLTLCILAAASAAMAGDLSPGLADIMDGLSDQDEIKVLVVMADQPDIKSLDKSLQLERVTLAERHRSVVGALQSVANTSQQSLLKDLSSKAAGDGIRGFTPHWIINAVVVKGTVAAIRDLALRSDVKTIEADLVVELIEPVSTKAASLPAGKKAGFVTPGVQAINADRVWRELGITGAGTLVSNMDSGVDGTHPALSQRWQGSLVADSQAWFDAAGVGSTTPVDYAGHGTHVMGTITGATAFDTVGVAPGARWIATNAINGASLEDFDNNVIAGFEWIADPDGNPSTHADVPDVCHNSWGVGPGTGFPVCDSHWWQIIDNCEAAGVVVTFSAGNEGPGPGTLRSPGDRATTSTNCFTIGSTSYNSPYTISSFSSRGPSLCGGEFAMKPEVSAPGESILSSYPGGGYVYMDGTSMAGPHVAGVVALMREAAPDLEVNTIKEILMATAIDLGVEGEDNTYGHGIVDAYAAVLMVLENVGTVAGNVTDADTGLPLGGVEVHDTRGDARANTGPLGNYTFTILAGESTMDVSKWGYDPVSLPASIPGGGSLTLNTSLIPLAPAVISGTVTGPDGSPVVGATITVLATPASPVTSDGAGQYEIILPSGPEAAYELLAVAPDLAYELAYVGLTGSEVVNFALTDLQMDGFESGGFASYPWALSGPVNWTVSDDLAHEGALSAKTGAIGHNQSSTLSLEYYVVDEGPFSFWYRTDSEIAYDTLKFYLDGELAGTYSGQTDWAQYTTTLFAGLHTFQWVYSKDDGVSIGQDAAWIDRVDFPGTGVQPTAAITLSSPNLSLALDATTTGTLPLQVGNTGTYVLDYVAAPSGGSKADVSWLTVTPASGNLFPGLTNDLTVEFNAKPVGAGVHQANLVFSSNDPAHPDTTVAVTLTVNAVTAAGDNIPKTLVLGGAVPNPFNPATNINFSLPADGQATLQIYDVSGRLVRTLFNGLLSAGPHTQRWNGRDDGGREAASGVYFARLSSAGDTRIKSMALVR